MGQLPPGLAKWQAAHKGQAKKAAPKKTNKPMMPPAVFNDHPGLPQVGKRHAKVTSTNNPMY